MSLLRRKIWSSLGGAVIVAVALSACGTVPATSVDQKSDPAAVLSGKVQSLQRQIRERDRRIEELEFQLNALKLIEQDFEKQRNPIRPPATLTPIK
jgi:Tfp pilus assembly protein PilN